MLENIDLIERLDSTYANVPLSYYNMAFTIRADRSPRTAVLRTVGAIKQSPNLNMRKLQRIAT